ncbi:MAG TPA: ABC transporter ATP-binding protein, partial [Bryobacteraceae bacterium]
MPLYLIRQRVTQENNQVFLSAWGERLGALKNVPPVLRIVWNSGRWVVTAGLILRTVVAVLPLAAYKVASLIIGMVANIVHGQNVDRNYLWILVALEAGIMIVIGILSRGIDYFDQVLADRYTRYVSVQTMDHASQLDLQTYEDPVYYDRLERARVQATDRLVMIQAIGRLYQLLIATASLSAAILWYSPWLLFILIACILPAFLGESHFAFLNYAKNFR